MNSRRAAAYALAAVLAVWLWQFLTVHYNYGDNWTGLFCIAPHMAVPLFLRSEKLYIFQGSTGFDGQVFHLIAHDPWMPSLGQPFDISEFWCPRWRGV